MTEHGKPAGAPGARPDFLTLTWEQEYCLRAARTFLSGSTAHSDSISISSLSPAAHSHETGCTCSFRSMRHGNMLRRVVRSMR